MRAIRGTYRNGQVILNDPPADWPEGAEVRLELVDPPGEDGDMQGSDPESIARWVAWLDSLKQYRMTDEEDAEFRRILQERKEWELANWEARAKKIEGLFP
jgi:hypothetical protein